MRKRIIVSTLAIFLAFYDISSAYTVLGEQKLPPETKKEAKNQEEIPEEALIYKANVQVFMNYSPFYVYEKVAGSKIDLKYSPVIGYGIEGNYYNPRMKLGYNMGACYGQITELTSNTSGGKVGISDIYGNIYYLLFRNKDLDINLGGGMNGALWAAKDPNIDGEIGYQGYLEMITSRLLLRLGYKTVAGRFQTSFGETKIFAESIFYRMSYLFDMSR